MRILHIDYHETGRDSIWRGYMTPTSGYAFQEAFEQLGHDVVPVNVRRGDHIEDSEVARCDLCWVSGQQMRFWSPAGLLSVFQQMPVVVNYTDMRSEPEPWFEVVSSMCDLLLYPCGGWRLRRFRSEWNFASAAFLPVAIYDVESYLGDLSVSGERDIPWFYSGSDISFGDGCRQADVGLLVEIHGDDVEHPGMFGAERVAGDEHLQMLFRSQRAVSVSHFHASWPKYTSSRTWIYMACGIDVACRWFPGCETMLPPETQTYRDHDELAAVAAEPRCDDRAKAMRRWVKDQRSACVTAQAALDMLDGEETGFEWEEWA